MACSNIFFYLSPPAKEIKAKISNWGLIKFKSFCTAKQTIDKTKRQLPEWEIIFANDTSDKGLISKIHKEFTQLSIKITNNTIKQQAEDVNKYFSKEDTQMADRHKERYSPSVTIREKQSETTISYYRTPVGMTVIEQAIDNKSCCGCREKDRLVHCWWECKLVQPLWKTM